MHRLVYATGCAAMGVCLAAAQPAAADILVTVSKSSQRVAVFVDGTARYLWPISSGRERYATPNGVFQPEWLARKWRSREYHNAPMPFSIFFHDGYALHGTDELSRLGRPASHGCVRLDPKNAAILFDLVKDQMTHTRIVVSEDALKQPGVPLPLRKPRTPPKDSTVVSEIESGVYTVAAENGNSESLVATWVAPLTQNAVAPVAAAVQPIPASPAEASRAPEVFAAVPAAAEPVAAERPTTAAKPETTAAASIEAKPQVVALAVEASVPATPESVSEPVLAHPLPARVKPRSRAGDAPGFHW